MTTDRRDIRTEADDILRSGLLSILGGAWRIDIWQTNRQAADQPATETP